MRRWVLPLLAIVLLLGIWQLYVGVSGVNSLVLPSPIDVARALIDDRGTLWHNFKPTALEIALGMTLGATLGMVVAVALHFSGVVRQTSYPLLVATQAIPIAILGPLLVVWLGFGLLPKLIVIALVSFFPVTVSTLGAPLADVCESRAPGFACRRVHWGQVGRGVLGDRSHSRRAGGCELRTWVPPDRNHCQPRDVRGIRHRRCSGRLSHPSVRPANPCRAPRAALGPPTARD
jgi:hypothetical protein